MKPQKILVIRFRQMGDAIMATPLLNTLHAHFPDAEIDFVINDRLESLFEGHPAISHIICFNHKERHSFFTYLSKVWKIMHQTRYDAIIDMRSTVSTLYFSLFSLHSRYRIGIRKPYTMKIYNYRYEGCEADENMIDHNLRLAEPLIGKDKTKTIRDLTLPLNDEEYNDFHRYMERQGIDFNRPVILVGVTAKLGNKTWAEDRMTETLLRLIKTYPKWQFIFNYAPGKEAEDARRIYDVLCERLPAAANACFLNIEARSPRQLAAMAACCTAYFGNEGGERHIVHAMGRPSFAICSPMASKATWLPQDTNILTQGIAASDLTDTTGMTHEQQYDLITVDEVWPRLHAFCQELHI